MKLRIAVLTALLGICAGLILSMLSGCARFSTTQKDMIYDATTGSPVQAKTTKAASYTVFSSKSSLATWKASQTDKTQGAAVGGLEQQGATNAVAALNAIAEIVKAAGGLVKP